VPNTSSSASIPRRLLDCLADGQFHFGAELGRGLAPSRTAVWKHLRALGRQGIDIQVVRARGYPLTEPVEWLDRERILGGLRAPGRQLLGALEVLGLVDSTNRMLAARRDAELTQGHVLLAEGQSAGRGRRGRQWHSPYGRNLYLSLYWRHGVDPSSLGGLSLALGVAVARGLRAYGVRGVGIKWPNDLVWRGRKLGGLLVELTAQMGGPTRVVVGLGVNVAMASAAVPPMAQPWVDVQTIMAPQPVSRNALSAVLIGELLLAMADFAGQGLGAIQAEWARLDVLAGQQIDVHGTGEVLTGVARGINLAGELQVEIDGRMQTFQSAEVSVRRRS
jgi:BirA family biotin operon repressor/biotin-[acetyl-CoA-carboxylase] ligase